MNHSDQDDSNLIIAGNLRNFTLIDACQAARDRCVHLALRPAPEMCYPDGRSALPLNLFLDRKTIIEVQRTRASADNKLCALDLVFPYEASSNATFSLRLVDPEPGDLYDGWRVDSLAFELAAFSDEMRAHQGESAVMIYKPVVPPGGSMPPKFDTEYAATFYAMISPVLEAGNAFTGSTLAEITGLSMTCCSLYLSKLKAMGLVQEQGMSGPVYGGTVHIGRRRSAGAASRQRSGRP